MSDRYDSMDTAELLREMCRKLDAIEKQGAPVAVKYSNIEPWSRDGYEAAIAEHRGGCALHRTHSGPCGDAMGKVLGNKPIPGMVL